jgi:hypothetical protein
VSRGLGNLQREIVEALDEARRYFADCANAVEKEFLGHSFTSRPTYRGGAAFFSSASPHLEEPGWVTHGRWFRLRDGVYDLWASTAFTAGRRGIDPYNMAGGLFRPPQPCGSAARQARLAASGEIHCAGRRGRRFRAAAIG